MLSTAHMRIAATGPGASSCLILGLVPFVLLENHQSFKNRLVWEEFVGTEFGTFAGSHPNRCLMRLEL